MFTLPSVCDFDKQIIQEKKSVGKELARKLVYQFKTSKIKNLNHGLKSKIKIYLNIVNVKQVFNEALVYIFHINKVFIIVHRL